MIKHKRYKIEQSIKYQLSTIIYHIKIQNPLEISNREERLSIKGEEKEICKYYLLLITHYS